MEKEKIARIKALYEIIVNREIGNDVDRIGQRVAIIRELERLCNTKFSSTKDFNFKIQQLLSKAKPNGPTGKDKNEA